MAVIQSIGANGERAVAEHLAMLVVEILSHLQQRRAGPGLANIAALIAQGVSFDVQALRCQVAAIIDQAALFGQIERSSRLQRAFAVV
ncbi:hypothetical protein PWG14_01695 (plasmid) [Chromobacterium amazonense]|nr:hypothetical protein [Chromobacterium amazonense]MDE1711507.1 hypothetical protein [Chromobacterium amazonense]